MRLGVVARGDRRGLAVQTAQFARFLNPCRVLGIDMGELSPYPADFAEYDPAILDVVKLNDLDEPYAMRFLSGLDVVLGAETWYKDWWVALARSLGVGTVLQYNAEFAWTQKQWGLSDVMVAPTTWMIDDMPGAVHLPLGVDRARFPFRRRTEAGCYLHVVGHPAAHDRAGTRVLFDALRLVKRPTLLIIRSQRHIAVPGRYPPHVQIDLRVDDVADNADLYADGDVLLLPRRYGGQSLPLAEALSCGMPTLMTDCEPQRSMLPPSMLVPAFRTRRFMAQGGPLWLYDTDPQALAARMDDLADKPWEVERMSDAADRVAADWSWEVMTPRWTEMLERLANRQWA